MASEERTYTYQDDGVYVVKIVPSRDGYRTRWIVRAYYRADRASTLTSATFSGESGRVDAEQAAAVLWHDYIAGLHSAPDAPPLTLAELVERFCARPTSKKGRALSPQTARSYRTHLQALIRVCGEDKPLAHIRKKHIEDAYQLPANAASKESYLRDIRILIRWAVAKGWMRVDVTDGIEYSPGGKEMRPWLQPEEIEPFLAACSPQHAIRAGLALETGMRATELVSMRWAWIRCGIGKPFVQVPASDSVSGFRAKGNQVRPIPLSERAIELLEKAKELWGEGGYVLHGRAKPIRREMLWRSTKRACKAAGVTVLDTHGLRRTAGSLWLTAGVDIFLVSKLLGHQDVVTTQKAYAGLAFGNIVAAIARVDEQRKRTEEI